MTSKKDTPDDKRIDELLIAVNSIQENMATKDYVLESLKVNFKEYHDRFNPNNLVVMKPSGMNVSGEQEQVQEKATEKGQPGKTEGPLSGLGDWAKAAESGISLIKAMIVPARDPRFDEIENMAIDITKNSMAGVVKSVANTAMRQGVTVHSGMTLDGHKD